MAVSGLLGAGANISAARPFAALVSPSGAGAAPLPRHVDGVGLLAAVGVQVAVASGAAGAGLGCAALPRAVAAGEVGGEVSSEVGRASLLAAFAA